MSSLYRTWRPATFEELVGQEAVVRTLTTALTTDRLAHAYLFSGPRGSGKTSAAKILARCIECVNGPTPLPCNVCENCLAILAGTALDVLEIDAASNRGIDEIRSLRDGLKFPPATMRSKVYIIDEAHMLTNAGANAFLKTLEEPPPYAVFILATTAPEDLPATVLSRCQRYAFVRITIETMIERMRTIAAAESISIDDPALGAIAYRADGGLRDALTMLEQVAAYANGHVTAASVDDAFGQTGREYARRLLVAALAEDAPGALIAIAEASDAGTDMAGLIRATMGEFRHLLVARLNPALLVQDLSAADARIARESSAAIAQARVMRALRLLGDALSFARTSGDPQLEVEIAMMRFILQREDSTADALNARITQLEATAAAVPAAITRSTAPTPAGTNETTRTSLATADPIAAALATPNQQLPPPELRLAKIQALWQNVRARAEGQKLTLRSTLSQTSISNLADDVVTLRVFDRTQAQLLSMNMPILQTAFDGVIGRSLKIRIVLAKPSKSTAE